ncbi:MAG: AzlC family ABC transporter permease [Variibacter sp.]|nr:AzlC family ABC transporter permease [Variibacter sp.]
MSSPAVTHPSDPPASAAFLAGMRAGLLSVFSLVLAATYVGIGALSQGLGLTLWWSLTATVLFWAAPAQVIFIAALAGGAPLLETAAAVSISGVRLLPMVVAILPLLKRPDTPLYRLLWAVHLTSIATWIEGQRGLPQWPRERRIAFYNGLGAGMCIPAASCTVLGYALAGRLPAMLGAALLFITPLVFLTSLVRNARDGVDRLALALGLATAPVFAVLEVGLDLVWTGVVAGTAAYAAQRWTRRQP